MIVILFGVTGVGKTTVGRLLAEQLGWSFYDADEFHPPENIEKMRHGVPLTDADRRPWLENLRAQIEACLSRGENAALACSALKEAYRQFLRVDDRVRLVYLRGDFTLIEKRLKARRGHFMNPALLESQFDALEEPRGDFSEVDVEASPAQIVAAIRREIGV